MKEIPSICVVGLGYVGLPLAVEFAKKYNVIGFDINLNRIEQLREGLDNTLEILETDLKSVLSNSQISSNGLSFTSDINEIGKANIYIITVPTPTDKNNRPDLNPLYKASETVGNVLKLNDIVIYESTVYPGATEEECIPVLERVSGLKYNRDFFAGYSPERINPGDKQHTVSKILKVTSGSNPEVAECVDQLYKSIIVAGTHKAPSIRVAEAAKVIENSQRDINIAFVNELSKIFNALNIDTQEVLEAAGTKWNFLKFSPGLVGGHCIGVDPYYLAQKAQEVGYHPEIILAGRRLNNTMGEYIAQQVIKIMLKKDIVIKGSNILLMGITFKENCPDVRNTRVVDIVKVLREYETNITIWDPWASPSEVEREYKVISSQELPDVKDFFDAAILAVAHNEFKGIDFDKILSPKSVIYDVKSFLPKEIIDARL